MIILRDKLFAKEKEIYKGLTKAARKGYQRERRYLAREAKEWRRQGLPREVIEKRIAEAKSVTDNNVKLHDKYERLYKHLEDAQRRADESTRAFERLKSRASTRYIEKHPDITYPEIDKRVGLRFEAAEKRKKELQNRLVVPIKKEINQLHKNVKHTSFDW